MKKFKKAAVIGIGLIGGSMALAIKKRRLAKEVVGITRKKKNLYLAKKIGAIDKGSQNLDIIKGADLLIFSTPVESIKNLASMAAKIIDKDCIVTDTGSTKEEIVNRLKELFPNYVGSHPLAGSEKQSISFAKGNLFKSSLCILTPIKSTKTKALNKIKSLWERLGAKTVFLSPKQHDKIISFVSHLPHVVAFSTIKIIPRQYLKFAASGLKDSTRIALSGSDLWADIFFSNRNNMLRNIRLLQASLSDIKFAIENRDKNKLSRLIEKARQKRQDLD